MGKVFGDVAPSADFVLAAGYAADGLCVGEVLFGQESGGQGMLGIVIVDGDDALQDDDAAVDLLVDEVDGAAGDLGTVVEGLLGGSATWECGEQ